LNKIIKGNTQEPRSNNSKMKDINLM
jgi:hypothetical protein